MRFSTLALLAVVPFASAGPMRGHSRELIRNVLSRYVAVDDSTTGVSVGRRHEDHNHGDDQDGDNGNADASGRNGGRNGDANGRNRDGENNNGNGDRRNRNGTADGAAGKNGDANGRNRDGANRDGNDSNRNREGDRRGGESKTVTAAGAQGSSGPQGAKGDTGKNSNANPESNRKGKEDGKVPAVGVGSGNTSLLGFLQNTTLTADATGNAGNQQAASTTTVTASSTQSAAVAGASGDKKGSQDGKVPAVGVGSGNTSLLPFLANTTLTAAEPANSIAAASSQVTRNTSVPVGSTAVVTSNPAQAGVQGISQPAATPSSVSISTVFVTVSPTFSGEVAGFSTFSSTTAPAVTQTPVTPAGSSAGAVTAPLASQTTPSNIPALGLVSIPKSELTSSPTATPTASNTGSSPAVGEAGITQPVAAASSVASDVPLGFASVSKTDSNAPAVPSTVQNNADSTATPLPTSTSTPSSSPTTDIVLGLTALPKSSDAPAAPTNVQANTDATPTPSPTPSLAPVAAQAGPGEGSNTVVLGITQLPKSSDAVATPTPA